MQNQSLKKQLSLNGNSWTLYINKSWATLKGISPEKYTVAVYKQDEALCVQCMDDDIKFVEKKLVKKLIKRSSGYGIIFSKPLLDALKINPEFDYIDIDLDNDILKIRKWQD